MERYRFYSDGAIYFVTFTVVDWLPVFVSRAACRIIADSLNFCHDRKGLRTNAYVIMPTHMHAVLFSQDFRAKSLKTPSPTFANSRGGNSATFAVLTCPVASPTSCARRPPRIETVDSGDRAFTLCRSRTRHSGKRRWTTCTRTRAARGLSGATITGGTLPLRMGCLTVKPRMM
jgi:hypothetical protein